MVSWSVVLKKPFPRCTLKTAQTEFNQQDLIDRQNISLIFFKKDNLCFHLARIDLAPPFPARMP